MVLLVLVLRVAFVHQAIQGDDPYYLYGAEHAQIDPLHPTHARYIFQGDLVDMRGHPHPPLDAWILGGLLAIFGDVREAPFHMAYSIFSIVAVLAMWPLARRFCEKPFLATLLFIAVPAFVVNGNSFEADLPFLAFWMAAIALFVSALHSGSRVALALAAISSALAALDAYQAVFLTPILAVYLLEKRSKRTVAWIVTLIAPLTIVSWQIFERATGGRLPAAMLAGYMQTYGLEDFANKARSAAALVVHSGWIVSPLIVLAAFARGKWIWVGVAAAAAAIWYDPNPLFWGSFACGALLLAACFRRGFLEAWVLIFFAAAVSIFFAGSARYLLPIAAPVAILAVRRVKTPILAAGLALQMALSLGLAVVNYQHWGAYRRFASSLAGEIANHRTWINAEWGLRYDLESEGALPLAKDTALQPGQIVVSSALALPLAVNAPLAPIAQAEIRPAIPLRIVSLDRRSAYSAASARGLLPFEISTAPIDRVRAEIVVEREPSLTFIDPRDPQAAPQIVSGLYPDGWMSNQATVLLKRSEKSEPLTVTIYIPDQAPARHLQISMDGKTIAEENFAAPGVHTISAEIPRGKSSATVTLTIDKTFSTAADRRKLGVVVTGIGFR
ncbi:MAG: glycosyltransferase family 39 protein [Bryobacteraceae bacterium]